jgi:gamma-glutamyltranspeptidase/glutathione hydrolase
MKGMVAAGHPLTAEAGARVLREGGNAVDAAVAAMLVSWVAEPLLTGPGAGGYMLVAGAGEREALLDFFVAAPGFGARGDPAPLTPVRVSFGDAEQVFNVGASSCGAYGNPAGIEEASRRWGTIPLADLAASAAAQARAGVTLNAQQAYIFEILAGILVGAERFAPGGSPLREGDLFRDAELAATIERLGTEGAEPFYRGDIAAAVIAELEPRGGVLTATDLERYEAVPRDPVRVTYRAREVLTNPPPNAGGTLLAMALERLDQTDGVPDAVELADIMESVQAQRTPEFVSRLGSTTHISVLDADGRACSVTCTNGEGCGIVVPGTGIHVNNIMGEEDLNPLGFHAFPAGRRMPSMMAPTVVMAPPTRGGVELVLGSAGSNRIRSAILQTIIGVVDRGLGASEAVSAPRLHFEDGVVYTEPGIDVDALRAAGRDVSPFRAPNLFFGGVQAVERDPQSGVVTGAGDPRRGGIAVAA